MITSRRLAGLSFIVFPLAIQIPFLRLARTFRYPDILREPPGDVLTAFQQGGSALIANWYLFAATIPLFLIGALLLPLRIARVFAAISAVVQMTGLLRWVFVVPVLGNEYAQATTEEARSAITTIFMVQHQALGVVLGEHLGQLFLALWTVAAAVGLASLPRALRVVGVAAGLTMLAGIADGFATVLPIQSAVMKALPMIAFTAWSLWLLALGVSLVGRQSAGTNESAEMLHALHSPSA